MASLHEVSRAFYAGDVENPANWLTAAGWLRRAAALLTPHVVARLNDLEEKFARLVALLDEFNRKPAQNAAEVEERRKEVWAEPPPFPEQPDPDLIYLMLGGFAFENLCKALLVTSLSPEDRERLREGGALPQGVEGHGLTSLAERIGFSLDAEERRLVLRLEHAVRWSGRTQQRDTMISPAALQRI